MRASRSGGVIMGEGLRYRIKIRFIISVTLLILYMGFIFWLSSLSSKHIPETGLLGVVPQSFKHFVEFWILGILMNLVISQVYKNSFLRIFYSSVFSISYGVLDEVHQYFTPARYCTLDDMFVDAVGSIIGVLVFDKLWRRRS